MAYTGSNWSDGVTPVDANNLNKLENGVADLSDSVDELSDQVDEINGKILIDYLYISSGSILDAADEYVGSLSNSTKKIRGIHLDSTSNITDAPSGFGYGSGFFIAFRDVVHVVLFSYMTSGLIATNRRSGSASWTGWYVFTGTKE